MAKTTLHITIPKPCHEDWSKMSPTQCGAFCKACQKEVIDFSLMSEAEIVDKLSKASGKVCGRITTDKLNRELVKHEPDHAWYSWKKWAVAAGVLLGVSEARAGNLDTIARPKPDSIIVLPTVVVTERYKRDHTNTVVGALYSEPVNPLNEQALAKDSFITLSGKITGKHDEPLDMAVVMISSEVHTFTDINGNYSIRIPQEFVNKALVVRASYLEYESTSFTVIMNQSRVHDVHFVKEAERQLMGLFITETPKQKVARFFRRIGNAFRKPENRH